MKLLKNHPFAVEAYFQSSKILTFAVPKEQLQGLIPECLKVDTFKDKYGFVAIAMVQTKNLRPKGFPKLIGSNFFLIGYRIFVRYKNNAGKNLRGLYILKSETDKNKMEFMGNLFTHYNYSTTDISENIDEDFKVVKSKKSNFELIIEQTESKIDIPNGSPFKDWKDSRKFTGPLPHTFTYNKKDKSVLIIKGVRQNWKPSPIKVKKYHFEFLNSLNLQNVVLANAFEINNTPYYWEKGKLEKWG